MGKHRSAAEIDFDDVGVVLDVVDRAFGEDRPFVQDLPFEGEGLSGRESSFLLHPPFFFFALVASKQSGKGHGLILPFASQRAPQQLPLRGLMLRRSGVATGHRAPVLDLHANANSLREVKREWQHTEPD